MTIIRDPTNEEVTGKDGFMPLIASKQEPSLMSIFINKVQKAEANNFKQFKPFCFRCAREDFLDWCDKVGKESQISLGYKAFDKVKSKMPELDQYGQIERFELIKQTDAMEPTGKVTEGGLTRQVKIGINNIYQCKERGCGVSIFIPNDQSEKVSDLQQPKATTK